MGTLVSVDKTVFGVFDQKFENEQCLGEKNAPNNYPKSAEKTFNLPKKIGENYIYKMHCPTFLRKIMYGFIAVFEL